MLPNQAQAVVIGSGICGSSVAYHLSERGWRDVVVLDQGDLCSGTTSHAPGLIGQVRASESLTRLLMHSVALYRTLRVDGEPGFFEVGSLRVASSPERWMEIQRQCAYANRIGLEAHLLTPQEAQVRFPLMDIDGVEGALYVPTDGSARAPILAQAMLNGASERGTKAFSHTRVTGFEIKNGRVRAVQTSAGTIQTELVVVASGIWSPKLGALAGVSIPLQPMQHQVIWTEPLPEFAGKPPLPTMRDPDKLIYFRQDGESLVMGGFERNPLPFAVDSIPDSSRPTNHVFDPEQFASLMENACEIVPRLRSTPLSKRLNGLESVTPDGNFLLGESPEVAGFWTACGLCLHGVSSSGGIGKLLAEWIVDGKPSLDLSEMDIRRFGGRTLSQAELVQGAMHIVGGYYDLSPNAYP